MKKHSWLAWLLIVTAALFIGACSSSDDDDPTGPGNDAPSYEGATTIDVPAGMAQSQDPMAQMAMGYIAMANSVTGHGGMFQPRGGQRDTGDTWTSTWTETGPDYSITLTLIVEELASMYTWDVYIDGTVEGEVFDDYHFYHAWEDKDGLCGGLTFYAYDGSGEMIWEWCTDTSGIFTMVMEFTNYSDIVGIEVVVNPDGSGSVTYSINGQDVVLVEWDTLGNGEWWTWMEDGTPTGSGSWTVTLN